MGATQVGGLMTNREALRKIAGLALNKPAETLIAAALVVVLSLVELPLPIFMALLIDTILPSGDVHALLLVGAFLFFLRSGASGFQVFQNYLVALITTSFSAVMRKQMIHKMLRLHYPKYLDGEAQGSVTRLVQDMGTVEKFSNDSVTFLLRPILSFTFLFLVMLFWSPVLAFYCALVVPAVLLMNRAIKTHMEKYSRIQREANESLELKAEEAFANIRSIKECAAEEQFLDHISKEIDQMEDSGIRYEFWNDLANNLIRTINTMNDVGFIFFAAYQVFQGNITIGGFVALHQMSQGIRSPIGQIMYYFTTIKSKTVGLERVMEVIEAPTEHESHAHATHTKTNDEHAISFKDVSLEYENGAKVIKELSLNIKTNESVALVGPSGAGKSTLANLTLALIMPTAGQVKVAQHDTRYADLEQIRGRMGVVFQDPILFNQTVRYNMEIGNEQASDEEIWQALKLAEADDFIAKLPDKLDTLIGVNGIKLSGGQKQRLAIARAILANPEIVILDEATSSLDSSSEAKIQRALDQVLKGRTSLVIAHRLSTILNCDRIVVIENGKIVEIGDHKSLIENKQGLYFHLYTTQTESLLS